LRFTLAYLRCSLPTRASLTGALLLVGACSGMVEELGSPDQSPPGRAPELGAEVPGGPTGMSPTDPQATPGTDPGRVTLHRLNRVEYNNTVRDLLGTSLRPADDFPADDRGSGFDNLADVLSLSPLHLDMYQRAADKLVTDTLAGPSRKRVVPCDLAAAGDSCAETVVRSFARKAWRRPVTKAEVDRLMTVVSLTKTQGDPIELGVNLALQAILVSPNFVFRVELDETPTSTTPHALTHHELAARLSYFLWSTTPDDELAAVADAGTLHQPAVLSAQITRMMKDEKASALVANFAGQWLYTRKIDEVQPDAVKYKEFDPALRSAMKRETELLFSEIAFRGLPADKLLTADFTFLNDRLAKHYGLPAVGSSELKRVPLTGDQRVGFLSHAGIMTVTSHPTSTSPVLRGKWVLNELFCQDIPPPPPGVDTKIEMEATPTGTLRQRLEQHRKNPQCAGCHDLMDPIGFGLENYDPVGAYRTMDGNFSVDASGALPDGTTFSGARQLSSAIVDDPRFARCVVEKLYTYALGRKPERTSGHQDADTLRALVDTFENGGFDFAKLVTGIAASDPFTKRRGEATSGVTP